MESDVRPPMGLPLTEDVHEKYDVFISHRGPDTKTRFVGHLYQALKDAGLVPFLDCESIAMGQDSWTCIEHAIKSTPLAVVIFSKSFAESEWCLKELHVMLHSPGVKVLPVFYGVKPEDVRKPDDGELAAGFEKLKAAPDTTLILIEQWRKDLEGASELGGWERKVTDHSLESKLVKDIVGRVVDLANKPLPLHVGDYVVGVDRVAEEIVGQLDKRPILMLGLWGVGGIGKSTLARELYNRLRGRFESACYIGDVTDKVVKGGEVKVQNHILKDLCMVEGKKVKDKSMGKTILEERLCRKRILLVLDDVRDSEEMGYWISRKVVTKGLCIVTSRNKRVFEESELFDVKDAVYIHDVRGLSGEDSRRVFASHAFGGMSKMKPEFEGRVESVSRACGGVPLLLKVCGAFLKGEENVATWDEMVVKLSCGGIMDDRRIFECLRISYDALSKHEQEMFLDVACGLVGELVDFGKRAWNSLGLSPETGVRNLVDKALITVNYSGSWMIRNGHRYFGMHDHLRDMGREIVKKRRQDSGLCTRLWMPESLRLARNGGLPGSLETLSVWNSSGSDVLELDVSDMRNLRILICFDVGTRLVSSLPKHLRWLGWRDSSGLTGLRDAIGTFPGAVEDNELVVLDMEGSRSEDLGEAYGEFRKLEVLNLSGCGGLSILPNSIRGLNRLRDLSLRSIEMECLPEWFGVLSDLEVLDLEGCNKLTSLPDSIGDLKKLWKFKLERSGIRELPESFGKLSKLEVLGMRSCPKLTSLPDSFGDLRKLRELRLDTSGIRELPESFGKLSNLEQLNMSCSKLTSLRDSFLDLRKLRELGLHTSGIRELPESFGKLSNLEVLYLISCSKLTSLPDSFGDLRKLRELRLVTSGIRELPESFGKLSNLEQLNMSCSKLTSLRDSFWDLRKLRELGLHTSGIRELPESFGKLSNLERLNIYSCSELTSLPDSFGDLRKLRGLRLKYSGIRELPESFGKLSNLEVLELSSCSELTSLPDSFGDLRKLRELRLLTSGIRELPESFGKLSNLEVLGLRSCCELTSLRDSFGDLRKLRELDLAYSGIRELPESFGKLSNLEVLDLSSSSELTFLPDSFRDLRKLRKMWLEESLWKSLQLRAQQRGVGWEVARCAQVRWRGTRRLGVFFIKQP